jgi:diguanylate cyclase (GGDEF)-like protein
MRGSWPLLAGTAPESRVLDSVAEFTYHRDIDALDHSLVLSLAELVTVTTVALCKRGAEGKTAIDSVVRCAPDHRGQFVVEASDGIDDAGLEATLQHSMAHMQPVAAIVAGMHRLVVPFQHEGRAVGAVLMESEHGLEDVRALVDGFVRIYANYIALLDESERDKLTGLYNRRSFDQRLQALLKRQRRLRVASIAGDDRRRQAESLKIWLAILDIDHFKRINDGYGHVYGDEVILLLAQMMRQSFRKADVLFRFGGEEFVILLGSADGDTVHAILERFRATIAGHHFPQVGQVTVSIGYARIGDLDHPETVLDRADKALYFAKEHGRNRVHGYEALTASGELAQPSSGSIDLF